MNGGKTWQVLDSVNNVDPANAADPTDPDFIAKMNSPARNHVFAGATAFKIIGRAGGIYGDFFNFYLCDISLKLNGLQPGGPVRTVKLFSQPSGRCTPQ